MVIPESDLLAKVEDIVRSDLSPHYKSGSTSKRTSRVKISSTMKSLDCFGSGECCLLTPRPPHSIDSGVSMARRKNRRSGTRTAQPQVVHPEAAGLDEICQLALRP